MIHIALVSLTFLLFPLTSLAEVLEDAIAISASGMKAQSDRMRVIAENIANANSTGQTPGADPYQRKTIIFKNKLDRKKGIHLINTEYSTDKSPYTLKFLPNHPAANAEGYVKFPNVNKTMESMDAKEAEKSYEANLRAIETTKAMLQRTVELLR